MTVNTAITVIFVGAAIILGFMFRVLKVTRNSQDKKTAELTNDSKIKLYKKIAGVCSGLSKVSDMPVWAIRGTFIVFTACYGFGIILYISLWLFLPADPKEPESEIPKKEKGTPDP